MVFSTPTAKAELEKPKTGKLNKNVHVGHEGVVNFLPDDCGHVIRQRLDALVDEVRAEPEVLKDGLNIDGCPG